MAQQKQAGTDTEAVILRGHAWKRKRVEVCFRIKEERLQLKDTLKYLGINFNTNRSVGPHIEATVKNRGKSMRFIKVAPKRKWHHEH